MACVIAELYLYWLSTNSGDTKMIWLALVRLLLVVSVDNRESKGANLHSCGGLAGHVKQKNLRSILNIFGSAGFELLNDLSCLS